MAYNSHHFILLPFGGSGIQAGLSRDSSSLLHSVSWAFGWSWRIKMALHMTRASGWAVSWHFGCPSCDLSLFSRITGASLHSSCLPRVQTQALQVTASGTPFNWSTNVTEPAQVQVEGKLSREEWQSQIAKDMQNGRNCCGHLRK